jgi:hypothetical protein
LCFGPGRKSSWWTPKWKRPDPLPRYRGCCDHWGLSPFLSMLGRLAETSAVSDRHGVSRDQRRRPDFVTFHIERAFRSPPALHRARRKIIRRDKVDPRVLVCANLRAVVGFSVHRSACIAFSQPRHFFSRCRFSGEPSSERFSRMTASDCFCGGEASEP